MLTICFVDAEDFFAYLNLRFFIFYPSHDTDENNDIAVQCSAKKDPIGN